MFTFHWSELLVVVLGGLALFFTLALLMLRRRNEMLQNFLTPETPDIEQEFFRVPKSAQKEAPHEDVAVESEMNGTDEEAVHWGTANGVTSTGENGK